MKVLSFPTSIYISPYESPIADSILCYPLKWTAHLDSIERKIVDEKSELAISKYALDGKIIFKSDDNDKIQVYSEDGTSLIYEIGERSNYANENFYEDNFIYKSRREKSRARRYVFRNIKTGEEKKIQKNFTLFLKEFIWNSYALATVVSTEYDNEIAFASLDLGSLDVGWEIPGITYKEPLFLIQKDIPTGKLSEFGDILVAVSIVSFEQQVGLDFLNPKDGSIINRFDIKNVVGKVRVGEALVVTTLRGWSVINLSSLEIQSHSVEWETDICTRPLVIGDKLYFLTTRYSVNRRVFVLVYDWKSGLKIAHIELPGIVFFGNTQLFQYGNYLAAKFLPDVALSKFDPYYNYLMLVTPEELLNENFTIELEDVDQFTENATQEGDERHYRISVEEPEDFFHFFRFMEIGTTKCANVRSLSKLNDEKPYDPDFNGLIIMDCTNIDLNDKEMDALKFAANRIEEDCKRLDKVDAVRRKPIRVVCEFKE